MARKGRLVRRVKRMRGGFVPLSGPSAGQAMKNTGLAFNRFRKTPLFQKGMGMMKEQASEMFEKEGIPFLLRTLSGLSVAPIRELGTTLTPKGYSGDIFNVSAAGTTTSSTYGYKYRGKPIKLPQATSTVQTKVSLYTVTTNADLQSNRDIPILDCTPILNLLDNYTSLTLTALFEGNFNVPGTVGSAIPIVSANTNLNMIALDRTESTMKIQNTSTNNAEIVIYDLMPKYDLSASLFADRNRLVGVQSPVYCWNTGLDDMYDIEDNYTARILGAVPTKALLFNTFWKVMKRTKVSLTGGATHVHRGVCVLNTTVNAYEYRENTGVMKGIMPKMLITVNGMPTITSPAGLVTLSLAVENRAYARSYVNSNITTQNYDDNLS